MFDSCNDITPLRCLIKVTTVQTCQFVSLVNEFYKYKYLNYDLDICIYSFLIIIHVTCSLDLLKYFALIQIRTHQKVLTIQRGPMYQIKAHGKEVPFRQVHDQGCALTHLKGV